MSEFDHDVVVIGSGFGGSVAALRLTEKGYKVAVLEAGKRYQRRGLRQDVVAAAQVPLDAAARLLRHPAHRQAQGRADPVRRRRRRRLPGLRQHALRAARPVLQGPGLGAHHRLEARDGAVLRPGEAHARRHDRTRSRPPPTAIIKQVAADMGVEGTFHHTPVGVVFGDEPGAETVGDPYFGGVGPERNACLQCGECMTGCRHNAKNTLVKNYLYLAENNGAEIHPLTTVVAVRPLPGGGYEIETRRTNRRFRPHRKITAEQVVFAASTMGTQKLLHRMRDRGSLPNVSRAARAADPHELRGPARSHRRQARRRLQPRHRDHVVVPPRRAHPRRAGALRQGLQRDVADADRAHRRQHRHARGGGCGCGSCGARSATCSSSTTCGTGRSAPSSRW